MNSLAKIGVGFLVLAVLAGIATLIVLYPVALKAIGIGLIGLGVLIGISWLIGDLVMNTRVNK